MMDDDVDDGIRQMWQAQPREEDAMSLNDIRARAATFDDRTRRQNWMAAAAFLVIAVGNLVQFLRGRNAITRVGGLLTVLAVAVVVLIYRRVRAPGALPEQFGLTSSLEFYRAHLVRQRESVARFWLFVLPFAPGIALTLTGKMSSRPMTPTRVGTLAALGALWIAVIVWMNLREARKVQTEIDQLDAGR
jgi:hypothetical protein